MKRHGASIALGLLLLACIAAVSGCPFASKDPYPEDVPTDAISGGSPTSGGGGPRCGDGHKDPGEDCDFGSDMPDDGCNADCKQEACWTCTTMGGSCTKVAPGSPGSCGQDLFCDDDQRCVSCVQSDVGCPGCDKCGEATCTANNQCASDRCVSGLCRRQEGEECSGDVECATNYCAMGDSGKATCAKCITPSDCTSNECSVHKCKADVGEPCNENSDCQSGIKCSASKMCLRDIGQACATDVECVTRLCVDNGGTKTCSPCTNTCPGGAACLLGNCASIMGYYCIADTHCMSMKCDGFPRTCQ